MGHTETISIPNEDLDLIMSYLADCQKKGLSKSQVVVSALKKHIQEEEEGRRGKQ